MLIFDFFDFETSLDTFIDVFTLDVCTCNIGNIIEDKSQLYFIGFILITCIYWASITGVKICSDNNKNSTTNLSHN